MNKMTRSASIIRRILTVLLWVVAGTCYPCRIVGHVFCLG